EGRYETIFPHQILNEIEQKEQHQRRQIDAAHIRQNATDRPQHRLGQPVQYINDQIHEAVARVDHVEGDEPAHNDARDQNKDVNVDDPVDQQEERIHE